MLADLIILVIKVNLDGLDKRSQLLLVLRTNLSNGNSGGGLLVDQGTKASLALDNAVGDAHLAAESREPDNQLNRVNVVSNHDQLSLLGLNQGSDVVQAVLDHVGLLGRVQLALGLLGLSSSGSAQTLLLLSLRLGLVLFQQTQQLGSGILVQGTVELVDSGRDLQALLEDGALALETHVSGPLGEAGHVALVEDGITDGEVAGGLLEQGNAGSFGLGSLRLALGGNSGSGSNLLGSLKEKD